MGTKKPAEQKPNRLNSFHACFTGRSLSLRLQPVYPQNDELPLSSIDIAGPPGDEVKLGNASAPACASLRLWAFGGFIDGEGLAGYANGPRGGGPFWILVAGAGFEFSFPRRRLRLLAGP